MKTSHIIAVACASLLAACAQPPSSPSAGPGATPASPAQAGALFARVCVANLPQFSGGPATLAGLPFTQNSGTSTYYHNNLNLSFSLSNGDCSLVFLTTDPLPGDGFRIGAEQTGINGVGTAIFRASQGPRGLTIVNARLPRS